MGNDSALISIVNTAFINDEATLHYAYEQGLSRDAKILTSSPNLINHPPKGANIHCLEQNVTANAVVDLLNGCQHATQTVWEALLARGVDHAQAITMVRPLSTYSGILYKLISLTEADFSEPRLFVEQTTHSITANTARNVPWSMLLMDNPKLCKLSFRETSEHHGSDVDGVPSLLSRLKMHTRAYWEYRAWSALWKKLPLKLARGVVYIESHNSLLQETVIHFARRGYAIRYLPPRITRLSPTGLAEQTPYDTLVAEIIDNAFKNLLIPPAVTAATRFFVNQVGQASGHYQFTLDRLDKNIFFPKGKHQLVFSNMPTPALGQVCRRESIPLIAFQHGQSREILAYTPALLSAKEETLSDLTITFNPRAAEVSNHNPFRYGKAVAVGAPSDYQGKVKQKSSAHFAYDIMYLSTRLYSAWFGSLVRCMASDVDKCAFEANLIKQVLAKLPCRSLFKPYPISPDRCPYQNSDNGQLMELIAQYANMDYHDAGFDFRYLLSQSRLLIVSRATSTLGCCLMTGKPLVFIDLGQEYALYDDAKALLKKAVFYFEANQPNFFDALRSFLQRPLAELTEMWQARQTSRQDFIAQYVTRSIEHVGKNAARSIMSEYGSKPKRVNNDITRSDSTIIR